MESGIWKSTLTVLCVIAFLAIVFWRIWPILSFKRRAIRVPGLITNWVSARQGDKRIFRPIIAFKTQEGELKTFTSEDSCEDEPLYPKETPVVVMYDPKDTDNMRVIYPK